MILSLAVLLLPIGLIFALWQFIGSDRQVSVVDPMPTYQEAADAGLDIAAPKGLSDDWKPVSSTVDRSDGDVTLRVGYHTPAAAGMQLLVSDGDVAEVVEATLRESPRATGVVETSGREWTEYVTVDNNHALVCEEDDQLLIVYGDAETAELTEFASALD